MPVYSAQQSASKLPTADKAYMVDGEDHFQNNRLLQPVLCMQILNTDDVV